MASDTDRSKSTLHKNHRQRLLQLGLSYRDEHIPEHMLMEMLLYFSIPRKDVNGTAHALINRFGGFHEVFDSPPEKLLSVPGIGPRSAELIHLISHIIGHYNLDVSKPRRKFSSVSDIADYMRLLFKGSPNEKLLLMVLDSAGNLITCSFVSDGTPDTTDFNVRKIVELALACSGSKIVLAHNHPANSPLPSDADITATFQLRRACDAIDLLLVEHLILTSCSFTPILAYISELRSGKLSDTAE